jgi:hypothetical protein
MGSVFSGIVYRPPHTTYGAITSFLKLTPQTIMIEVPSISLMDSFNIIGVGDMVLGNNLIERVRYIAEQVEKHPLNTQ